MLLNIKDSLPEIVSKLQPYSSEPLVVENLFIHNFYNETYNLQQYLRMKSFEDILTENLEIRYVQDPSNHYFIIVKHGNLYNSFELELSSPKRSLFKKVSLLFSVPQDQIHLIDEEGEQLEDGEGQLGFEERHLNFILLEKNEKEGLKNIKIFFLSQECQTRDSANCEELITERMCQKHEIMAIINKHTPSKDLVFYKSNLFLEPTKRLSFDKIPISAFELEPNNYVFFVKVDGGFLNIETIKL